jgi:hypothetical protein
VYIQRLFAPVLFITMLLSGGIFVLPSQAIAGCCGCGNCWMMYVYGSQYCYCGGNCPTCLTDDFDPARQNFAISNGRPSKDFAPKDLSTFDQSSALAETFLNEMISGSRCFRVKVALSLLGNVQDRFVPIRFSEEAQRQNSVF